jgi:hypothetical protein
VKPVPKGAFADRTPLRLRFKSTCEYGHPVDRGEIIARMAARGLYFLCCCGNARPLNRHRYEHSCNEQQPIRCLYRPVISNNSVQEAGPVQSSLDTGCDWVLVSTRRHVATTTNESQGGQCPLLVWLNAGAFQRLYRIDHAAMHDDEHYVGDVARDAH